MSEYSEYKIVKFHIVNLSSFRDRLFNFATNIVISHAGQSTFARKYRFYTKTTLRTTRQKAHHSPSLENFVAHSLWRSVAHLSAVTPYAHERFEFTSHAPWSSQRLGPFATRGSRDARSTTPLRSQTQKSKKNSSWLPLNCTALFLLKKPSRMTSKTSR